MNQTRYTSRVDPVIYGHGTDGFERADWLDLAFAAIDQAGIDPNTIIRRHTAWEDGHYLWIENEEENK